MTGSAVSIRALTIGVILSAALNLAAPYAGLVMNSQFLDTSYFPIGLGIFFFVILLGANALLRFVRGPLALREGELAVIFVMAAVAGTMPTHGTVGKLLSFISAPRYLASAENRWAEVFFPRLPRWIGYQHGAFTTGTWLFNSAPWIPYDYVTRAIRSEPGVEWAKLLCAGIGGSLMLVLTALHHRLCWWPLHPLGLVVGMILKVRWCFLPFLAGWLCKVVLLRVGGAAALRRAKPFFLGAMVGWFAGVGVSMAVDALFFPGQGHVLCWH